MLPRCIRPLWIEMAITEARAFWVTGPGRGEIRPETIAEPGPGEVTVRTLYSAISRGTETLVFNCRVPASEYERMRAPFQSGNFPAPVKYGYVNVGVVEDGPPEWRGRNVFCLYPHQTRYVVGTSSLHAVPDGVPAARAVLAANLETAINGLWDAEPLGDGPISVIGAGAVGCLAAWYAHAKLDREVELIDIDPRKRALADALGLAFVRPEDASAGATTILHASGSPEGLRTALRLAGFEGSIIELSWYGIEPVCLPLGEAFHSKRLTLRSSQVGTVARARRADTTPGQRLAHALATLAEPALDALISGESGFDELPALMRRLSASNGAVTCQRITYSRP